MIWKLVMTAGLALIAGWMSEAARADEAYICDGGHLIYVKSADVPRLKMLNPCVAKYFGLEITVPSPRAAQQEGLAALEPAGGPTFEAATTAAGAAAPTALVTPAAATSGLVPVVRQISFESHRRARPAVREDETAVDYRNVRVINAQNETGAVFRHRR